MQAQNASIEQPKGELDYLLKHLKKLLLPKEEITKIKAQRLTSEQERDKMKAKESKELKKEGKPTLPYHCEMCGREDSVDNKIRELPCRHVACPSCIEQRISDSFVFTCSLCKNCYQYFDDASGFFVYQGKVEEPRNGALSEGPKAYTIRVFGEGSRFLNFQFAIDFADQPIENLTIDAIDLETYLQVLWKDKFQPSVASLQTKKHFLLRIMPLPVKEREEEKLGSLTPYADIAELSMALNQEGLQLYNKQIFCTNWGRSKEPILAVAKSFLPYLTVRLDLGRNVRLVLNLLKRLRESESPLPDRVLQVRALEQPKSVAPRPPSALKGEGLPTTPQEPSALKPNPPPPLKTVSTQDGERSYKNLIATLYQAPANELEEELMKKQQYRDFCNPVFRVGPELLAKAQKLAESLAPKPSHLEPEQLPIDVGDFCFDIYNQIKCNQYHVCCVCVAASSGSVGSKDKDKDKDKARERIVYSNSIWTLPEGELAQLASHKCLDCAQYLCPLCAAEHKRQNLDHKFQFKVDRKDYYRIRRPRQEKVIKSMNELIKEKVRCLLDKVNQDISAYLFECLNEGEPPKDA